MSKRKLSERQQARIQQLQKKRRDLAENYKDRANSEWPDEANLGAEQEGLLIAFYGVYADVEDKHKTIHRCYLRQNLGTVVTGDNVIWREKSKTSEGIIVAVMPRKTLLSRPVAPGKIKAIAANVNQMFLVIAVQPRPAINMIDSYLVAAEINQLKTVLVCNKSDLLVGEEKQALLPLLERYKKLNYPVIFASAQQKIGLAELQQHLENHTSIFVGQSGVGKSSLVGQLLPEESVKIDLLSPLGSHGMHTTTAARLYHLASGGDLIDSPGVRDFRLWNIAAEKIAEGFIEFRPYLGRCQFRDCTHLSEKNCALLQGVTEGAIDELRLHSYQRIVAALQE